MGNAERVPPRSVSPTGRTRSDAQRRHCGLTVGQDDAKRGPRGYDGGKKIAGRKRTILVDTLGLLMEVYVHPADLSDKVGAIRLLIFLWIAETVVFPRMKKVWEDKAYEGVKDFAS